EILVFTLLAGWSSFILFQKIDPERKILQEYKDWTILCSTILFSTLVTFTHFGSWIPVEISSFLASPAIIFPPLAFRNSRSPVEAKVLISDEETKTVRELALTSQLVRKFH